MKTRLILALAAACALAACMEKPQTAGPSAPGRYAGKPDTEPYQSQPTAYGSSKWQANDRASWDKALATRAQTQNEYARTP